MLGLGGIVLEQGADRVYAPLEAAVGILVGEIEADEGPLGAGDLRQLAQVDVVEHVGPPSGLRDVRRPAEGLGASGGPAGYPWTGWGARSRSRSAIRRTSHQ